MIVDKSVMLHILIRSVLLNGWSLLLTAALTVIIVYLFTVIGYVFFREDFVGTGHLDVLNVACHAGLRQSMCDRKCVCVCVRARVRVHVIFTLFPSWQRGASCVS